MDRKTTHTKCKLLPLFNFRNLIVDVAVTFIKFRLGLDTKTYKIVLNKKAYKMSKFDFYVTAGDVLLISFNTVNL